MGFSYRKSFKVGKNTRVNLSRTGGIGISTGVKGARVSCNNKGVRTSVGKNGVQYRKDYSLNNGNKNNESNNRTHNESTISIIWDLIKSIIGMVWYGFWFYVLIKIFIMFIKS